MNTMTYREETNGLLYPQVEMPEQTDYPIGKYGHLRLKFLKEHRRGTYETYLTQFRLNEHLHETEAKAKKMVRQITEQLQKSRGITEQMKADDPLRWTQEMNNVRASAEEIVLHDLICV